MCGFVVVFQPAGQAVEKKTLHYMASSIAYRGPDDQGFYHHGNVGLAHNRLSIIDLSRNGRQPMASQGERYWIVYNGEVYNFKEIREKLQSEGYQFRSNTDTEVVLAAYEEWGEQCLERLNGMFAFAIYDRWSHQLFLARDRLGIKPLYYYWDGNVFIAASEMRGILAYKNLELELDHDALFHYLQYEFFAAPSTVFKNVKKLEPGFWLRFDGNRLKKQQYWELSLDNLDVSDTPKDLEMASSEIDALLTDSVTKRLISDVPLGTFLSGGIDSGLITSIAARQSPNIRSFNVNFQESSYSESPYAQAVAEKYKTNHSEFNVSEGIKENLDDLLEMLDEPFGDISFLPTYYLSKYTREHVTVALSGDGGDELFGGYYTYLAFLLYQIILRRIPYGDKICQVMDRHLAYTGRNQSYVDGIKRFAIGGAQKPSSHIAWMQTCDTTHLLNLLDSDLRTEIDLAKCNQSQALSGNQMLLWDMKHYLPENILYKTDRASMLNSLEVRVPFLDHRLVEYVFALPFRMKVRRFRKKHILKQVAGRYLPRYVINRKKMGFSVPFKNWVKEDLRDYVNHYLISQNSPAKHLFDREQVKKILDQHVNKHRNYSHLLWNLLVFNKWYERYGG